jgi:hypothetical protein
MTRKQRAKATGHLFYIGKVCLQHPELKGQRRTKNGNCHKCICERMARPRNLARQAELQRRRRAATRKEKALNAS